MPTTTPDRPLVDERFISLTTYRRDGTPVATPVWCAGDGGSVLVFTGASSGKVKRIRNDPHVSVAPSGPRGKPHGPALEGQAQLLDDTAEVVALLAGKYGWTWRAYDMLMRSTRRMRRQPTPEAVTIRITLG